jgi:hypothetical protein
MSQLGLGLGLTRGGGVPFNPLSLNPYLLFDTRSSMIGTFENPTLDLDPSKPDTLNVITATRAGTATYTDANGVIQTASPDAVRVDYTQGEELTPTKFQNIGYTDFSQDWTLEGSTLPESQTTAPDGTTPVYELTENTGTSRHRLFLTGISLVVGQDYTVSAYVKKVSSGRFFLINSSALNGIKGFLNLDTGVATLTSGTGTIAVTDEGNGWYRLSVTAQATTTNGFVYMQLQNAQTDVNYTGTGASMLIWGPQLEEGTTASDFVANTTGSPKFTGISATYGPRVPMILCEPSATNLLTHSEDFSVWVKAGEIETTTNFTVSPDGTQNATKLELTGSSSGTDGKISFPVSTASQTHTFSVYAKKGSHNYIYIWMAITGGNITRWINLDDGSHSGSGTATLKTTEVGNDWWKIEYTFDATNLYNIRLEVAGNFISTGTGGDNVYIWGAQLEAGSVATSYIPTSGGDAAARTRAADDLVISGSDFDFYNQSEGTFYVESIEAQNSVNSFLLDASNGFANYIDIFNTGSDTKVVLKSGGTPYVNKVIGNRSSTGVLSRVAISYKTNNVSASIDGVNMAPDTSATMPTTINKLILGADFNYASHLNGHFRRIIYWPLHSDSL